MECRRWRDARKASLFKACLLDTKGRPARFLHAVRLLVLRLMPLDPAPTPLPQRRAGPLGAVRFPQPTGPP
jgi:hypothetical protein